MGYPQKFSSGEGGKGLDPFYFPSLGSSRKQEGKPVSIEEQTTLFLSSKGNPKIVGGPPYRLIELNKLKWFWKNLGLTKLQLQEMSPDWIGEIYSVGLTVDSYVSRSSNEPVGSEKIIGNKKVTKLL